MIPFYQRLNSILTDKRCVSAFIFSKTEILNLLNQVGVDLAGGSSALISSIKVTKSEHLSYFYSLLFSIITIVYILKMNGEKKCCFPWHIGGFYTKI